MNGKSKLNVSTKRAGGGGSPTASVLTKFSRELRAEVGFLPVGFDGRFCRYLKAGIMLVFDTDTCFEWVCVKQPIEVVPRECSRPYNQDGSFYFYYEQKSVINCAVRKEWIKNDNSNETICV